MVSEMIGLDYKLLKDNLVATNTQASLAFHSM